MTIQIKLFDGVSVEEHIYRKIARHNYSAYVAGFMANKGNYMWGVMQQLKGNEVKVLHTFGDINNA